METQSNSAEPALKPKATAKRGSTYYRRKNARKQRIKQAKRKYGLMLLLLLILPSVFIGYSAYQLTEDLRGVQEDITTPSPLYEAIRGQNEELKQDTVILSTYANDLANLGKMGEAIKKASEEFGQNADEAVKLQGLMLGIANAESGMGKNHTIAYDANCFNYWGLKGGNTNKREDGSYLRCFISESAGARTVAKTLKLYYLNEGKTTPETICQKWIGAKFANVKKASGRTHCEDWVFNVNKYFTK